ncbi:MAG: glycosyltransferase family 2 protein [Acidobacteria bacterium]|nr:glycosyltransferase family 2 protein [Acidobacteriota bacterium]
MSARDARQDRAVTVDVVIPVLNEAHVLEKSVERVRRFLERNFPYTWRIVIVENGSTDGTFWIAEALNARYSDVAFLHLAQPGRGQALRCAWMESKADVVCYMDVDLSTDLSELSKLIRAIIEEEYDIAIGSRLLKASQTKRSWKREIISRLYNIFVKAVLSTRFSDAQCGFKAVTREVVDRIVPQVENQSWFFDTELLVRAEKQGYKIKDIPVVWKEDDDSRVKILPTAWEDIKGVFRLYRQFSKGKFRQASVVDLKAPD